MATTTTEEFDVETFRNLIGKFDSNQAGGGDTAFRKAVILCTKYGVGFCEAVGMAFGQGDDRTADLEAENATLREDLEQTKQGGDELADALAQAKQTIAGLQNRQTQERGERHMGFKTGLKACFRHIWSFAQFRLLALTLMIEVAIVAPMGGLCLAAALFLFIAWGVAQCRKQSFGQTFMKSLVYFSVITVGGMVIDGLHGELNSPVGLIVLLLATLLTLSRLNEWLCEQVRMRVWESNGVRLVRGWF